jgi:hypothetical protein
VRSKSEWQSESTVAKAKLNTLQMWVSLAETHPYLALWDSPAGFDTRFDADLGRTLRFIPKNVLYFCILLQCGLRAQFCRQEKVANLDHNFHQLNGNIPESLRKLDSNLQLVKPGCRL